MSEKSLNDRGRKPQVEEEDGLGKAKRKTVSTPTFTSQGCHVIGSHWYGGLAGKWFAGFVTSEHHRAEAKYDVETGGK